MTVAGQPPSGSQAGCLLAEEACRLALVELGALHAADADINRQLRAVVFNLIAHGACDPEAIAQLAVDELVLISNGRICPDRGKVHGSEHQQK